MNIQGIPTIIRKSVYGKENGAYALVKEVLEEGKTQYMPYNCGTVGADTNTDQHQNDNWYACREQFLYYNFTGNMIPFVMYNISGVSANISAFIAEAENRIGLKEEDRIQCYQTSNPEITLFQQSKWWDSSDVRRQLLTILLRQGQYYKVDQNNFEEALYYVDKWSYTVKTKRAVQAFLNGRTIYDMPPELVKFSGWVNVFNEGEPSKAYNPNLQRLRFAA